MVFWHRPEHDSEKVQMWIDNTKFIFENFTFNPDCATTEENELSILFGKGAQYQSDVGITQLLPFAPPEALQSTWSEVGSSFAAGRAAQGWVYGEYLISQGKTIWH
jgi:hypothetical protein